MCERVCERVCVCVCVCVRVGKRKGEKGACDKTVDQQIKNTGLAKISTLLLIV